MCKHFPQKFIKIFVREGIMDLRFNVLSHIKDCQQCEGYYKKVGGDNIANHISKEIIEVLAKETREVDNKNLLIHIKNCKKL